MAWYRVGGGGIPSSLKTDMNDVLNKKFGTSVDYPPTDWAPTVNLMGPLPEKTASGAIVTFSDGADEVPLKSWKITLPASLDGYSAIHGTKSGKNLFDKSAVEIDKYLDTTTGLPVPAVNYVASDYIPVFSGVTIFIPASWTARRWFYDKNKTPTTYLNNSLDQAYTPSADGYIRVSILKTQIDLDTYQIEVGSTATTYEPYTAPTTYEVEIPNPNPDIFNFSESSYQRGVWKADGTVNPDEWSCRAYKIPIESGATYDIFGDGFFTLVTYFDANDNFISSETLTKTADFHEAVTIPANCAYLGVSYEGFYVMETKYIKKAFNVYGGSIEAISGEGTSAHANVKVSDLTWTKQTASDRDFFIAQVPTMKSGIPEGQYNDIVSDIPYGGELRVSSMADKSLASWTTSLRIYDTDITTVSELLEAYGNDGISYPLATPETFTFTPIPTPETALGVNNFWADEGDSEITYRSNGAAEYYPAGEEVSF